MLKVLSIEQSNEWDTIVRGFKNYDTYWLSGYVKAFQIHGDGEPLLFYYEDATVRGINVVMKRDIAKEKHLETLIEENKWFDFVTPYGYGGWIIEGDNADDLFSVYEKWCRSNGIVSEFVRFHPLIFNHVYSEKRYEVIGLGNTVSLDLSSPEIIWANITSKNRNVIRKAKKNGVKIYNGRFPEIFRIFRNIYNETMDKDNAEKYYYFSLEFYDSICEDLPHNAQVFYAVYKGQVIATSIMLTANKRMNYHLSGSLREFSSLASTNLLLYEAALWGCENGYKTLYLGGGVGSEEDSLFKFKKSFCRSDTLPQFYIGKKIFEMDKYKYLTEIRGKISKDGFFPQYRA
ncbi:GNAT family N-acetyltransferase [Enterococcus faecium]|uniref:lipid II:glycine glycyltransferase FemX n=1 Tax=Enterococcus TaxID=1350 RepID=UPI0006B283E9|nr:GNAT family N-acetyltransferase [Enterococcus faecium]EGP4746875.1 GNAT family N-acetyltransferase [Enterococcus faecium]EGP5210555.1 GNAT family N-acetyltransferase [Enterococcus faecium]EGP5625002.1 GNAT family N-acetyltransferase [Enterococcus faecium]EME3521782.1 GNAT family N-acetyltransferase [Enterococcus faecium]EMF0349002.1 GNAT family N-acetyltransferase [Enterococcus faecium]